MIEGVPPTVTIVATSTGDGTYPLGTVIPITINFSEPVTVVGGTPTLTLETGAVDSVVSYVSGSPGTALLFNYTVGSGNVSSDLNYVATTSLALAGSTIKDAAGNNATLALPALAAAASLGGSKTIVIDGVLPTLTLTNGALPDTFVKDADTNITFTATIFIHMFGIFRVILMQLQ